jgi:hypothetical protein
MSLKEFGENDVVVNTMVTNPRCQFFIYNGSIYYNNQPAQSGAFASNVKNTPSGFVSLYEINIDRNADRNPLIYPFVTKQSSGTNWRTVSTTAYSTEFAYGDVMTSSYPMSASITRELMVNAGTRSMDINPDTGEYFAGAPVYRHFYALKNKLNYYGTKSEHYKVSSSYGDKSNQTINLISIPSIFYGQNIKPGSISMKWYVSGTLAGELQDTKRNGELIEVTGSSTGSVAGVVLYNEGFVLLTGSWNLSAASIPLVSGSASGKKPSWIYWGAGAQDGVSVTSTAAGNASASFDFSFQGVNDVQVVTMFAHARKGEVNYSNNPTYLTYGEDQTEQTSSYIYEENPKRTIHNTVSSSYRDYNAPFKRQVYISRVAVYDENKNLIGIATLANPILKKEDQDISFKIKLDI